jgi:murein DD-endopeptidase MepM/ murein hydrolase activator NlpD
MPPSCGRRNRLFAFIVILPWLAFPAWAETNLTGRLEQGSLVVGRTSPDARVSLDGRPVPVGADGLFLLGFGRNAEPTARLDIRQGEALETRSLSIARRDWRIQRIEGLPRDKVEPDPANLARIKAESAMMLALRTTVTIQPRFDAGFTGLDIAAPKGQPVRATADGVVVLAAPDLFLTGQTVMIDHGLGLMSSYAHLSRLDVAPGRRVTRGEIIGAIGATGLATGAHLHWGLSWLDVRLDPEMVMTLLGSAKKPTSLE